jgi:hypothetical protein
MRRVTEMRGQGEGETLHLASPRITRKCNTCVLAKTLVRQIARKFKDVLTPGLGTPG